ncbi:TPA: WxL domain-containing protein [Enterococcus faecalis]|nr:WxL domain-containing protein [Enterococcus faecalis]
MYYHLTQRKVTENFVDTNGAKITPPTGFTQGKQTAITSDPYTFKQAGTLPDTYTTGGKTYKFKGWYKGKTKPSTLTTTKAPSYGVTYDDNDDLNVVYEETKEKTTTIPAVTYKFGFVDEKGALVAPTNFNMTTNLTTIMNGTPKQVGTASGVNNGNLKQLTIPSQQLTYTPTVNPAFSGSTNFRVTVPKQYKLPTVKPGTYYTGSSTTYPIATTKFRYVGGVLPDSRLETDGKEYGLFATTTAHSYRMYRDYWIPDTTKTYFSGALSRVTADGNTPAYYTTDETIYYFLENRRVTENFVDTSGAKITPPTGFTQGKKTVISSDTYHFKLAKELPYSYYTDGKAYQFKGWYKGKTKPAKLETTRTPEYDVSYNDDDDVTTIYEEIKYGGNTVQFGFVGEDGQLINPTGFKVTTDVVQTIDGVSTTLNTLTAGNATGNLKTMTIPQKTYPLGTTANYFGTKNSLIEIPRQYLNITFKKPTDYQGKEYPVAERVEHMFTGAPYNNPAEPLYYTVTKVKNQQYKLREITWEETNQAFSSLYKTTLIRSSTTPNGVEMYPTGTIYYYLKNRRVTENFVDTSSAKITPPTGFTQGKKTAITSDAYTFKQAGTLPDTYTTGGKTYKFKGWYKGKSILNTLTTTKAPSYQVTYDDNDDLNVVYEEVKTFDFPESTYQFGFVDVATGNLIDPSLVNMNYTLWQQEDGIQTNLEANQKGVNVGNLKSFTIPEKKYQQKASNTWYGPYNMTFTIPKQYKTIDVTKTDGTTDSAYPIPSVTNYKDEPVNITPRKYNKLKLVSGQTFEFNEVILGGFPGIYSKTLYGTDASASTTTMYYKQKGPVYYYLTNRTVTENFVDTSGAKITPPTGFTQGNQVPMTSDTFKYTAAKALPATYTAGGKTYTFQGWYKGKTKPSTLNKTTTPTFNATFDGNDDMTAMYKEEIPMASVTLTRPKEVIDTNTNVIWTTTITNTSKAPLQNLTLKKGPNWSAGLTIPSFMEVTPEGGTTKSIPVTNTLWTDGVPVPNAVPVGKKVSIAFTTRATGNPNTVLKAEVVVFGGIKDSTVDNFVRIRPNDQEVVTPTTEGFISVPTFDFGQVGVAGTKQQHSLKQAADYYGNGTRNPYVRIKKTQPNWSLTAQLSQPKSATDSLPTATRLLLGAAPVSSFTNYNQPTELKNAVGTTSAISLTANNTATSIIANKQFTGSNVYQLDFTFNNVKLEVPANQGVKGQQYKAAVTWNLVTGP